MIIRTAGLQLQGERFAISWKETGASPRGTERVKLHGTVWKSYIALYIVVCSDRLLLSALAKDLLIIAFVRGTLD